MSLRRFYLLPLFMGINWINLQRLSGCPNWDSLLGSLGMIGWADLLQVTPLGDMSQIMTFLSNKCLTRTPPNYDCWQ